MLPPRGVKANLELFQKFNPIWSTKAPLSVALKFQTQALMANAELWIKLGVNY